MTTTNDDDDTVKGILAGGAEALAHLRGEEAPGLRVHAPETVNARRARKAVDLSQREFAALFGLRLRRDSSTWGTRPLGQ